MTQEFVSLRLTPRTRHCRSPVGTFSRRFCNSQAHVVNMARRRFPLVSQELQCFTDVNNFLTWSRNLTQVKQFSLLVNFLPRWVLQRGQANQKHPPFFCLFFLKGGRHRGAKQTELSFWVKMISGWFWHLKGQSKVRGDFWHDFR